MSYRKNIIMAVACACVLLGSAQAQNVKIPKGANRFTYWQIEYGEKNDTSTITVERVGSTFRIVTPQPEGKKISGYAQQEVSADWQADSITVSVDYADSMYYYRTGYTRGDIDWKVEPAQAGAHVAKYTCSINSNTLVFEMDTNVDYSINPLPWYGLSRGVLRSFTRNGQRLLVLGKAERVKGLQMKDKDLATARRVSPRELDNIMKERLVVTTRIFDHEQIHWGAQNAHIEGGIQAIPYDTVLHFAGGTVVLKRVRLPKLPGHYQHFVELHQQSNGDAYDRTGSVFMMLPVEGKTFFDGINNHPDSLPVFTGRDGERYQGMMAVGTQAPSLRGAYQPPIELVRFFTPFGVGHFNERMAGYGIDWRDETYYRQEITDVYYSASATGYDVVIGAWIGNYDGGGHRLTMDIKSYPNSYAATEGADHQQGVWISLFNTCNVLEMAGQNYGKLFATDSLTVRVVIPQGARLRYISTGHGGWGEGDEFVPKQNTILIDGKVAFTHTPWRQDCGCYRDLNPVSGNYWNGLSSSDFSRSGWCPGTATQPVYFDLTPWADGKEHTLTVAIPQGKPVESMFSHWAVSGVLVVDY